MKIRSYGSDSLNRPLHSSWLLAFCSLGILLGTAGVLVVSEYIFASIAWLFSAGFLVLVVFSKRRVWCVALALVAGGLIGLVRGSSVQLQAMEYQKFYTKQVVLVGTVIEDVEKKDLQQRIRIGSPSIQGQSLVGQVWLSVSSAHDIKRGDKLEVEGKLSEGFGNFLASMFSAKIVQHQRVSMSDVGREARDWFIGGVEKTIPYPQSSLANGYLLGKRSALPESLADQLRNLGLTHIIVASGFNLTILVRFARRTLSKVSKYLATTVSFGLIGGFIMITGMSPSMTRAGLVTGLSLLAWYYGRNVQPLILLLVCASITVLYSPAYIWGDIGWYLSFLAFGGVVLLAPLLHHYFWGNNKPGFMRQLLIETSSAQIVTLPIVGFVFGQFAPLALVANALILPFIPLVMILTFVAGLFGLFVPSLATIAGAPATAVLQYMLEVTDNLSKFDLLSSEMYFGSIMLISIYTLIVGFGLWMHKVTKHNFDKDNIVL